MKRLLLPLFVLACAACSSGTESTTTTEQPAVQSCPELSEPQFAVAGQQPRRYYTAPGFNPKSKECWAALRAAAAQSAKSVSGAAIIAYIDAEDFTPGKDGMYDKNDAVRQKVIAQVLVNNDVDLFEFTPDPFGYGKYTEPK